MYTYRAVEVTGTRQFALVEREAHDPGVGQVRLRVEACGVCHSDVLAVEGLRPDPGSPVVPGHEIIGVVDAVGPGIDGEWQIGDRVGVGFLNGHDGKCEQCRRGDFVSCTDQPWTGTHIDGGYAEVSYARSTGLVRLPAGVSPLDAAPLMCAGLTVYTALRRVAAPPGALVGVQGIGGLGHLGIQYAKALGYQVVAVGRGTAKAELAAQLGAVGYIDTNSADPGAALAGLGGAAAVLATAPTGASMSPLLAGLAPRGQLIVVGATPDPIQVSTADLIFGTRTVTGNLTGSPIENEDNVAFADRQGIRSHNEVLPLSEAPRAYERMLSGEARFRVVLDTTAP